jgi:hypothetical protein
MNTVAFSNSRDVIKPAVILRYGVYKKWPHPDFRKTSAELYHGGSPPEEVAALSSLIMGMRLRAGRTTRRFETNSDPRGKPAEIGEQQVPYFQKPRTYKLPFAASGPHSLMDLTKLQTLARVSAAEAIAIVRSARLYQDALWLAEPEPELAWLLLVSALETAAKEWRKGSGDNVARLKCSKPELYKYLEGLGGSSVLSTVADHLVDSLGLTKKFKDFLIAFLPGPPSARPAEWAQFKWEEKELKRAFVTIYRYRSKALHDGRPFPMPMCAPGFQEAGWDAPAERMIGNATSQNAQVWLQKDVPMILHLFEHIARNALLRWWDSCAARNESSKGFVREEGDPWTAASNRPSDDRDL